MPLDSKGKPVLNKPFKGKSTPKGKKFSVYVKADTKKGYKTIHFGQAGADDWRSGKATPAQRKSYLARAKGIKNKNGELTYKIKSSPNYWSVNYLW
tara:strand:+ start:1026 stop:1313 length:288 start_codon:yes stop_codon:yes gene_type:complete